MENSRPIKLTKWVIYAVDGGVVLGGIADEHPKLGKNVYLAHTSYIAGVEKPDDNILLFKTRNSIYKCDWKFVNIDSEIILESPNELTCGEELKEIYKLYIKLVKHKDKDNVPEDLQNYYDLIKFGDRQLQEQIETEEENLMLEASKYDECIYMNISMLTHGNLLAYNIKGYIGVLKPDVRAGAYSNIVNYSTNGSKGLDVSLSYYSTGNSLDIKTLSGSIGNIVLHNNKVMPVTVNGRYIIESEKTVVIKASEITD